jgi:hypothetical protein
VEEDWLSRYKGDEPSHRRAGLSFAVIGLVAILLMLPQVSLSVDEEISPSWEEPAETNSVQYVNFTNPSWNWTTRFYNVSFPQGSWEKVTLTLTLVNHGDPWDRANVVGVNSVMILEMTTKENSSATSNPVQIYTRDVTIYSKIFNTSAEVYWSGMPNYMGGWYCELSFAFFPGTPPMVLPDVLPALFHITLSATNMTSFNVTFPQNITSAKAVLTEEGHSNEEFWFANVPPTVRDYTLDINTTRVFDITGYPYLNSGACLNPPNCWTLYEWNGTPPPGTGLRPQHVVDISPFVSLLNGTQPLTFGIGNGASYWKISLSFLLWRNPRLSPYILDTHSFERTATSNQQYLNSTATAYRDVPNGVESIEVTYRSWLNASFPVVDTHTIAKTTRTISSVTVTVTLREKEEIYHNVSRDGSGAGDVHFVVRQTNISKSLGNGQDFIRFDHFSFSSFIDGDNGGRQSTDTRLWKRFSYGDYIQLGIAWDHESFLWRNITSSLGVGQDEPPYLYEDLSGVPFTFPAVLFIGPAYNSEIGDVETIFDFLFADDNIINSSLSIDSASHNVTNEKNFTWDTTEAYGPRFIANVTTINEINITSFNEIPLLGIKSYLSINFTSGRLGWNFISIPQPLENDSVENVLSSIAGKYDAIYYYDVFDPSDRWKSYLTFKNYQDLQSIDSTMGFWINITTPGELEIVGPLPNVTSIFLRRGWNMVGFPSLAENYTVFDLIADTGAIRVEGFADVPPYYLAELPGDYVLRQGEGYWIEIPSGIDWVLPSG